jgi:glycosyltransferase involved in cell wall biosynthesis
MTDKPQLVYIQNSVHLAGAQKSLSRIIVSQQIAELNPILITSQTGWLTRFAKEAGVQVISKTFPKSRSLKAKLFQNRSFTKQVRADLQAYLQADRPVIVHANDHPDSLIALELARSLKARSMITLRTPSMSERDFMKYRCNEHDTIISVGDELHQRARSWSPEARNLLIYNGVTADEFHIPEIKESAAIDRVLVLGSTSARKGWQDVIEALIEIEKSAPMSARPKLVFLGDHYGETPELLYRIDRLEQFEVQFIEPVENYSEMIRQFPLVIHPSRSESFGMSALETIAGGVPLLAAKTGMITEFVANEDFLYSPQDVSEVAGRMLELFAMNHQELCDHSNIQERQRAVRVQFSTENTINALIGAYIRC